MAVKDWHRVRVLAIAAFIASVPVFAIMIWAVTPIWNSIAEARKDTVTIRHLQQLMAEKPMYQAELSRANAGLASAGVLYSDSSPELASAQLQNTLQGLVAQADGQIQSSSIGTPQIAHGLDILSVTVSLVLPSDKLPGLLTSIDAQKPYLTIQGIDIRSAGLGGQSGPLSIQMQVNGFSLEQ